MNKPSITGVTSNGFEEPDSEPPLAVAVENKIDQQSPSTDTRVIFPINTKTQEFINQYFPGISFKDWNSWSWQLKNSAKSLNDLQRFFELSDEELFLLNRPKSLPIRITPYYMSLMDRKNPMDPIRRTMIPVEKEMYISPCEISDPLGEENQSPVPQLVHRYPDRALFLVTGFCASYCRYCTRSHMVSEKSKTHISRALWNQAIEYIQNTPQIRDVIISGGDPLTMPDSSIDYLLNSLFTIPHVEMVRIGTKTPVVLPQRITPSLMRILRKYQPLFINIHFTHPSELTVETKMACSRLANAGIPLGSQTVLLKGINDSVDTMKSLMHELLKARVRPYYIYQCDPIPGSSHFRTPVEKGLEIIQGLRGFTSGLAVPHYVIDSPGGGGKIPLLPEYYQGKKDGKVLLRNFEGKNYFYPDEF
ncbi:MAG: KamA family radical SAM protein [Bacteroidales bacterium]|nr:KamA family radical SAM protein [Bacteroidales bacterium]